MLARAPGDAIACDVAHYSKRSPPVGRSSHSTWAEGAVFPATPAAKGNVGGYASSERAGHGAGGQSEREILINRLYLAEAWSRPASAVPEAARSGLIARQAALASRRVSESDRAAASSLSKVPAMTAARR